MSDSSAYSTPDGAPRRRPTFLAPILVLLALILVAVGLAAWIVKPLVHSAIEGAAGTAVATWLVGVAQAVDTCYQLACNQALNSDQLKSIVGEPMSLPPLDRVRFLEAKNPRNLEFEFTLSGPTASVLAHAVCTLDGAKWKLVHMHVTDADGQSFELTRP